MSLDLATLLAAVHLYGYSAIWLLVFLSSVGVPLPTEIILIAAGAMIPQENLSLPWLIVIAISAAGCGDGVGYLIGWRWGGWALIWLERSRLGHSAFRPDRVARTHRYFHRYGGWAVFLTRWLIGVGRVVINLLAGAERFSYRRFVVYDLAGNAVDVVLMLAVGLVAGASWRAVGETFHTVILLIGLALIAGLVLGRVWLARRGARLPHSDESLTLPRH